MQNRTIFITLSIVFCFFVVFSVIADYTQFVLRIGNYFEWVYRWDADGEEDDYEKANASTSTVWSVINKIRRYEWVSDGTVSCDPSDPGYLSDYTITVDIDGFSRTKSATHVEGAFSAYEHIRMQLKPAPHNMPTPDINICSAEAEINGIVSEVP